jgi:hypothetical protein
MKRYFAIPSAIVAAMVALFLNLTPASAQATRTWMSGVGDDGNSCSRTAPCKTFAGAIAKTATNGEINCLDPGGFGVVIITQSITLDCHETTGSIINASDGVSIDFDLFASNDIRKTVNLRNLMLQGLGSGSAGVQIQGAGAGSLVNIEDCLRDGNFAGSAAGINDGRTRGALTVTNVTVRNMLTAGISVSSQNNGSLRAMISNTRVFNSAKGIVAGSDANIVISHSVISNNVVAGLVVSASSGLMVVDSTVIAHNGIGFQNSGTLRLSNSDAVLNSTGSTGTINSFTNNRFTSNGAFGPIVPIGSTSNPTGQQ